MIKRIIFDLDDTLIPWKEENDLMFIPIIEKYNLDCSHTFISNTIDEIVDNNEVLTKKIFLKLMNEHLKADLPIGFVNEILKRHSNCFEVLDLDDIKTLEYLKSKYELVVLTNWFEKGQTRRLKKSKIKKYFKKVYGLESMAKIKPNKEAFKEAIGKFKIEECIMIGNSYNHDIVPALEMGMKVIMVDLNNTIKEKREYPIVKSIKELKNLL